MTDTIQCGSCLSQIPSAATRCSSCGGDPRGAKDRALLRQALVWFAGALLVAVVGILIGGDLGRVLSGLSGIAALVAGATVVWELVSPTWVNAATKDKA